MTDQAPRCPTCRMTDAQYKRNLSWAGCTDPWHGDDHLRRPTPSERPVAQVREQLETERNVLNNSFGFGSFIDGWTRQRIEEIDRELAALTSERPSEAAVAWRYPSARDGGWNYTSVKPSAMFGPEPPYAIPREAIAWTEEERHTIAHARHQVEQASPEKPDCCFDFDLVKDLLRVIDRSIPHGDAVRAALLRADEADWKWLLLRLDRSARGAGWRDIVHAIRAALSPTLASERVSERETMTSVPAASLKS